MQKHIRYEVEIIACQSVAPSLAQLHGFFLEAIQAAEKAAFSQTVPTEDELQPRRGRPKKAPPAAEGTPAAASKRPEEELFTIRRTETPLDVYLGELDEAVEKLKMQNASPPQPAPLMNPKWIEKTQSHAGVSTEPKYTISGVAYVPELPDTIADPATIEMLKNVSAVKFSESCKDSHIDSDGVLTLPRSTHCLAEIDETA